MAVSLHVFVVCVYWVVFMTIRCPYYYRRCWWWPSIKGVVVGRRGREESRSVCRCFGRELDI
jgi:hypothetical protein